MEWSHGTRAEKRSEDSVAIVRNDEADATRAENPTGNPKHSVSISHG
jgi:hypothetical protein